MADVTLENNLDIAQYTEFFRDELDNLDKISKETEEYAAIIKAQVESLKRLCEGNPRGTQKYLIEYMKIVVTLEAQKQSVVKEIAGIKKMVLDYALKKSDDGSDRDALADAIKNIIGKTTVVHDKYKSELNNIPQGTDDDIERELMKRKG